MELKVREVRGLETVFDFDPKDKAYRAFLRARNALRKDAKDNYNLVLSDAVDKMFYGLVKEYIDNLGLKVKLKGDGDDNPDVYRVVDEYIPIHMGLEGIKIIPGREDFLDGYEPELIFSAKPNSLTVKAELAQEGRWDLMILEDFAKQLFPDGDGKKQPKICIKNEHRGRVIYVASIEQVSRVVKTIQELYSRLKGRKFKELADLSEAIETLDKNSSVVPMLAREYENRIRLLTPTDLC